MPFAIIETGGKQYKVKEKDILKTEKIEQKVGAIVRFDRVLLTTHGKDIEIGTPYLKGKVVPAKVLEQGKAKKVLVIKFKSKVRYRRKRGHRQPYTKVQIEKIT